MYSIFQKIVFFLFVKSFFQKKVEICWKSLFNRAFCVFQVVVLVIFVFQKVHSLLKIFMGLMIINSWSFLKFYCCLTYLCLLLFSIFRLKAQYRYIFGQIGSVLPIFWMDKWVLSYSLTSYLWLRGLSLRQYSKYCFYMQLAYCVYCLQIYFSSLFNFFL